MDDATLIRDFLRVVPKDDGLELQVLRIHSHGPHTPVRTWHPVKALSDSATEEEIEAAYLEALADRRWFTVCTRCDQKKPSGLMHHHDPHICQPCAERYLDVIQ